MAAHPDRPLLVDRPALLRLRARAAFIGLREAVAADTHERILDVNRTFTAPALVSPFPAVWADLLPGARAVPDDPVLALEPGAHDLVSTTCASTGPRTPWANSCNPPAP